MSMRVSALLAAASAAWVAGAAPNLQTQLKRRIMAEYGDPAIRPGAVIAAQGDDNGTCVHPDEVHVQVHVEKFHPLDGLRQTWQLEGYLRLWWTDPRLAFEVNDSAKAECMPFLDFTGVQRDTIWSPDVYLEGGLEFERGLGGTSKTGLGQFLRVSPKGEVTSSQQTRFVLSCPLSLQDAPFDTQECPLSIGLYSMLAEQVRLSWRPKVNAVSNAMSPLTCFSQWVVTGVSAQNTSLVFSTGTYTYANAVFAFTRVPSALLYSFMLPAVFFVLLSYLGFWWDGAPTALRLLPEPPGRRASAPSFA